MVTKTQAGHNTNQSRSHPHGPNRPSQPKKPQTLFNPISPKGWTLSRDDMGVDASAPNGTPFLAPATSYYTGKRLTGWETSTQYLYVYKFDPPLSGTPHGTQYWYVAEGIQPTSKPNQRVKGGQKIAVASDASGINSIEFGWSATDGSGWTLAQQQGDAASAHPPAGGKTSWAESFKSYFGVDEKSTGAGPGAPSSGGGGGGTTNANTAQAFVAELNFPSVDDEMTAIALGAEHKGLMHDQQLLPFIQQLAQGSMRSFQSLPDGSFYAFYPDYFGEFGQHDAYWLIDDIEILSGGINLTDDALATHVFAVGDNTWPVNNERMNMLFSAGAINVFNAFLDPGTIADPSGQMGASSKTSEFSSNAQAPGGFVNPKDSGMHAVMSEEEAVQFIERYGARPLVNNYPMVRSNVFEMLLAYQQFMYAWASQFNTPYTFTFMPELYPGGKVGFPSHGLKMYINSVTHSFDYESGGFTTEAELVAPSLLYPNANPDEFDLPPNMVRAMVEPVANAANAATKTKSNAENTQAQNMAKYLSQTDVASQPGVDRLPPGTPP